MDPVIKKAYEAAIKGQSYAFATIIESTPKGTPRKAGAKMIVLADGSVVGTIGGGRNEKATIEACQKALKAGKPNIVTFNYFGGEGKSVCGGQIKVFVEPFAGKKHFVICGAGHIGLPLSVLGKMLNFKVTIIDNRKELANKERFPHVDEILCGNHTQILGKLTINEDTFIMIVTQGNEYDYECLKAVISAKARYIGVISSKAKRIKFFRRLKDAGISEELLNRIKIPAGLDVGAMTPEEIALSIATEIVAEYNKSFLNSAKFQEKLKSSIVTVESMSQD